MIFSKVFKNIGFIKIQYVEDLNPVVGFCESTLSVANLAFDYSCSNWCSFRDMTFFGFFQMF